MSDTEVIEETEDVDEEEGWRFPNGSLANNQRNKPKVRKREIVTGKYKKAWSRQKGESVQAFEAFMTFLMLGKERTCKATAQALGKSVSLMSRWSWEWSWHERAAAYEEHFLMVRLESFEASRDRMFARHETISDLALSIVEDELEGMTQLKQIAKQANEQEDGSILPVDPVLKGDALIRLFDLALKNHRMAVLGRVEAAEKSAEEQEALAERYSDELVNLMNEFMRGTEMTAEQIEKARGILNEYMKKGTKEEAA